MSASDCCRHEWSVCLQVDIGDVSTDDIMACDSLIIGAPTWHTGADSERSGTVPRGPRVGVLPFALPWERSEGPDGMGWETAASIGVALPKSFRVPMMA